MAGRSWIGLAVILALMAAAVVVSRKDPIRIGIPADPAQASTPAIALERPQPGPVEVPPMPRVEITGVAATVPPVEPPPAELGPRTHLQAPVPMENGPVTVARLPLALPTTPGGGNWARPEPLPGETEVSPAPRTVGFAPHLPSLVAATPPLSPKRSATHRLALFTGSFPGVLENGGIVVPAHVRDQFDAPHSAWLYAVPGPEQCVRFYTEAGLARLVTQLDESSAGETSVRRARRLCFAQAEKCSLDASGRVHVPEHIGHFAGLQHDVVLIGVGDHLELWDSARWQHYVEHGSK